MRIDFLSDRPDRAGRYTVKFDDGTSMRLYRQTVEDFGLYTGKEFTQQELADLRGSSGRMSAKMRAVRIVAASSVSRRDLEQRLVRKGEDPQQAREAVEWMQDLRLVDDRQTAADIVSRCSARGYGKARAKQMLYEKQIPRELWEEALSDYPEQTDKIIQFLHSRLGPHYNEKDERKAIDALLRRGHSYGAISRALAAIGEDSEIYPED